jgi:hypothetical protein
MSSSTVPPLPPQFFGSHKLYNNASALPTTTTATMPTASPTFTYQQPSPPPPSSSNPSINANNFHFFPLPPNVSPNSYPSNSFQSLPFGAGSASASLPKAYVNSVDEYLRIIEVSLRHIRSLWRSRTASMHHPSSNVVPPHMHDINTSPPRRQASQSSQETASNLGAQQTSTQEQVNDNEMINYLIWNCCVMLSKLFVSPQPWHFSAFAAHPTFSSYIPFISQQFVNTSLPTTPATMHRSTFGSTQSLFTSSATDIPPYSPCSGMSAIDSMSSIPTTPSPSSSPLTPPLPLSPSMTSISSISNPPPTLTFVHPSLLHSQTHDPLLFSNNSPPQLSRTPVTLAYLSETALAEHEISLHEEEEAKNVRNKPAYTQSTVPASSSSNNLTTIPSSPLSPISPTPISPSLQSHIPVQRLTRSHSSSLFATNQPTSTRSISRFPSSEVLKAHFSALFSSPSHPYGYALLTFLTHMQDERGEKMRRWVQGEMERRHNARMEKHGRPSYFLNTEPQNKVFVFDSDEKELHELQTAYVSRHLVTLRSFIKFCNRLVLITYPTLSNTTSTKKIMLNTLQSFLYDQLSKTMSTLYAQCFEREDDWMLNRLHDIQQYCINPDPSVTDSSLLPDLNNIDVPSTSLIEQVPPPLNYTELSSRFSQTIEYLRNMLIVESIRDKWTCLVNACRMASYERNCSNSSTTVNQSFLSLDPFADGLMASSDDLISTIALCLAFIAKFDDVGIANIPTSPVSLPQVPITRDRRSSSSCSATSHLPLRSYRVYSQMRLMSEWMNERSLLGIKGFCITTWTCSMEYLAHSSLPTLLNTFLTI